MIKILELFSGYGTNTFALKRLGFSHKIVGYSDTDKWANKVFQQNHGGKELGDVKNINPNELEDFDLLTGGFPCQSFSVAGHGLGEADPRGTLFAEIIRIAEAKKPRYMLLENVKGLTNNNHKKTFNKILAELKRIGYFVRWDILNTKHYGIPQNRERVFFVCFRNQEDYDNFEFPQKEELKIFIKDILENEVDKKYYLSEKLQQRFKEYLKKKEEKELLAPKNFKHKAGDGISTRERYATNISPSLQANAGGTQQTYVKDIISENNFDKINSVQLDISGKGHDSQQDRLYDARGVMCCLPNANPTNKVNIFNIFQKNSFKIKQDNPSINNDGTITAIDGSYYKGVGYRGNKYRAMVNNYYGQLRRLTPKECFRLQGFLNDEVNLEGLSDTQKYKLAGNGQSVNVVEKLFKNMFFKNKNQKSKQQTLPL